MLSEVELDTFGAEAGGANAAFQPRKFTTYERDPNGTDEAMFRRYNRWHARFDQPDPYEGSYDPSDPQSFNRYAYVNNDPVNFIDPTGLDEIIDDGDVVTIDTWAPAWPRGGPGSGGRRQPLLDVGGEGGGGGAMQEQERRRDCYEFADKVAEIAKNIFENNDNPATNSFPHNRNAFLDELAREFTELYNSSTAALLVRWGENAGFRTEYGTENFAPEFVDTEPLSDNQARHAVFGILLGASGSTALRNLTGDTRSALQVANDRENPNTNSGRADIAVNNQTVPMGEKLMGPGGELFARDLAKWIRDTLCAKR